MRQIDFRDAATTEADAALRKLCRNSVSAGAPDPDTKDGTRAEPLAVARRFSAGKSGEIEQRPGGRPEVLTQALSALKRCSVEQRAFIACPEPAAGRVEGWRKTTRIARGSILTALLAHPLRCFLPPRRFPAAPARLRASSISSDAIWSRRGHPDSNNTRQCCPAAAARPA
jgi:hypothetical protein